MYGQAASLYRINSTIRFTKTYMGLLETQGHGTDRGSHSHTNHCEVVFRLSLNPPHPFFLLPVPYLVTQQSETVVCSCDQAQIS